MDENGNDVRVADEVVELLQLQRQPPFEVDEPELEVAVGADSRRKASD